MSNPGVSLPDIFKNKKGRITAAIISNANLGEILSDTASYIPTDSSALIDTAFANFYTAQAGSDFDAIQAYENQLLVLDTANWYLKGTSPENACWSAAKLLLNAIPTTNTQAVNYRFVQGVYLKVTNPTDTTGIDSTTLASLFNLAWQCPYVAGDAVYAARSLCAQFADSLIYDDLQLCQPDTGHSGRMFRVAQPQDTAANQKLPEFVKVYPNPAKQLINLAFNAKTAGIVNFELFDALGAKIMETTLSNGDTYAQYSTANISNGIYYWRLRDAERIIKTGKLVILK